MILLKLLTEPNTVWMSIDKDRRKKAFLFYLFSTMKNMKGGRGFVWGLGAVGGSVKGRS